MLNYRLIFAAIALSCCASAGATQAELSAWVKRLPAPGLGKIVDCSNEWMVDFKELASIAKTPQSVKICIDSAMNFASFKSYSERELNFGAMRINKFFKEMYLEASINYYILLLNDYRYFHVGRAKNGKVIIIYTADQYYNEAKASDHFFDSYIDPILHNIKKIYKQYLIDLKSSSVSYGIIQCSKIGNGNILQDLFPIPIKNCRILVQKTDVQILVQDMGDQFYLFKKSTNSTRPVAKAPF